MGLAAYTPKVDTVGLPDGESFTVRALNLEDIVTLVRSHYETASSLYDRFMQAPEGSAAGDLVVDEIAGQALDLAPGLIADTIAQAAGEPDKASLVKMLPTGVQVDAIDKCLRLTLEAEGGVGKLAETVSRVSRGLTSLQDQTPEA